MPKWANNISYNLVHIKFERLYFQAVPCAGSGAPLARTNASSKIDTSELMQTKLPKTNIHSHKM